MPTQKALVLTAKLGDFVVQDRDIPQAAPGYLVVKIEASALNPVDWKVHSSKLVNLEVYPAVLGMDGAGVVEQIGADVSGFQKGDRILFEGSRLPPLYQTGTFQQYATYPADLVAKIPEALSFDQAASVPLGLFTAAIGLYNPEDLTVSAGLKPFWQEGGRGAYKGQPIIVFGGSSSVGQYALQIAHLSGFSPIITTASLHNTELLKSLGATHVLDRNLSASDLGAEVRKITDAPITVIYDSISLPDTQNAAYDILAPGGQLVLVLPLAVDASKITPDKKTKLTWGSAWQPLNRKVGASLWASLTKLLEDGEIKPNHVEVLSGGLSAIPGGLERLKNNQVSGVKLVVHPQETT